MVKKTDTKTLSDKLATLDEMIAWFNEDDFALEEAVDRFKQADALAKEIETDLSAIKNEITVLAKRFDE